MPGPASDATTTIECRPPVSLIEREISPEPAYSTRLRASSEIAVATRVRSLPVNPACSASSRPRCRAARMSCSDAMRSVVLSTIGRPHADGIEERDALLQIECRGHVLHPKAQL